MAVILLFEGWRINISSILSLDPICVMTLGLFTAFYSKKSGLGGFNEIEVKMESMDVSFL